MHRTCKAIGVQQGTPHLCKCEWKEQVKLKMIGKEISRTIH